MDIDEDHLLPEREKDAVKALSLAQHRILDVDMDVIRRSVLANVSPASLLPWLAWDRSVDEYVDSWPESVKRQVIAGSFNYHAIKGTPAALKRALAQLDFETTVTEWFQYGGDPYRFRISFSIAENGTLSEEEFRALFRLVFAAKNVRSYLDAFEVSVQVRAPAPYVAAWGHRRTRNITIYPEDVEGPGLPPAPMEMTAVDAFTTTEDGQLIVGKDIWCDGTPLVINHRVILRWCRIWHRGGPGIQINAGGEGSQLCDFMVTHVDPPAGVDAFPTITDGPGQVNIFGYGAQDVQINRVKLSHGASGIYLQDCSEVHARFIEGGPMHGPLPRGQLYQQNGCTDCTLLDWSVVNPVDASHPEDCVNIYQSQGATIARGRAVDNGAPNGVAVMFESGSTGQCYDVDATGMWNGAFSAFGAGTSVTFERVRTRDNYEPGDNPSGRMPPSTSNGATFVAADDATAQLIDAAYHNVSNPLNIKVEYDGGAFTTYDAADEDFVPRSVISVELPDWPAWEQPPDPEPENLWAASALPSNAAWSKNEVTATAGAGEGGTDAVRETATTGEHSWSRTVTKDAGAVDYEIRFRIKPQGRTRLNLFVFNAAYSGNSNGYFFFHGTPNFQAGGGSGGMGAPSGGSVVDDGDGFFECSMAFTSSADTSMPVVFYTSDSDYAQSHAGNVSLGFDIENLRLILA